MNKCLLLLLILIVSFTSCIEEIDSFVGEFESSLVVDGLITDEHVPYEIRLTRTTKNTDEVPESESGAEIVVEDDLGNENAFFETDPGVYLSDPSGFTGEVNRSYRLKIRTKNNRHYESSWCELMPPGQIDSVYWRTESYESPKRGRMVNGVVVFADGKLNDQEAPYSRWTYEEDWKFYALYREDFKILEDESFEYVHPMNWICWKNNISHDINIYSINDLSENRIEKLVVKNIQSADNDRLTARYSITVKQLSISKEEYTFWKELNDSEQDSLDLFGKQPYSIPGNIYNIDDPSEKVLGYFQVAGVAQERIYIDHAEAHHADVSIYRAEPCRRDTTLGSLYMNYDLYYNQRGYGLAELLFPDMGPPYGIVFTDKICSDCTLSGKNYPPDFWEEE